MKKTPTPINTRIGETALAEEIRVGIENAHRKSVGREREEYLIEKVFPLLSMANELGYSVELNSAGVYELRKVEGKWEHPTIRLRRLES